MKIERNKEWWLSRARREGDATVSAGLLAFDPAPTGHAQPVIDETRIAFGIFINLMRRRRGLSIEKLAKKADVDASELLIIEESPGYVPDPRTVFCLARMFDIPQQRLMQLAGLATAANDADFRQEAVRFAARAESVQKLTAEQSSVLEAFVAVLSQQEPKPVK